MAYCGEGATVSYGMIGPGSHVCDRVGRAHRSNHVYFLLDFLRGQYCQKCYDPDCAGAAERNGTTAVAYSVASPTLGFEPLLRACTSVCRVAVRTFKTYKTDLNTVLHCTSAPTPCPTRVRRLAIRLERHAPRDLAGARRHAPAHPHGTRHTSTSQLHLPCHQNHQQHHRRRNSSSGSRHRCHGDQRTHGCRAGRHSRGRAGGLCAGSSSGSLPQQRHRQHTSRCGCG